MFVASEAALVTHVAHPRDPAAYAIGAAKLLYDGAPLDPEEFPKTVFAPAFVKAKVRAGVDVAVATLEVNRGERFPAENVVTVPALPLIETPVEDRVKVMFVPAP